VYLWASGGRSATLGRPFSTRPKTLTSPRRCARGHLRLRPAAGALRRLGELLDLPGLRPSPTRHVVVGFRISSRLTQGPAVSEADRHHSLRLGMLTTTRGAYLHFRCAVVALWSEHQGPYAL
jgi:hypothetical protein